MEQEVQNSEKTTLVLWGFRYSVYTRIAKMALVMRDVPYQWREANPFSDPPDQDLARVSPFGRVPVLDHGGFVLCETDAICRYVAAAFPGTPLMPHDPKAAARADQVIAVIDAYGYRPMVRQVFSHAVFRPLVGAPTEPAQIEKGLAASVPVLGLLNQIAEESFVLNQQTVTLADLHLAPMVGYFVAASEGDRMLRTFPALGRWWNWAQTLPVYTATDPDLGTLAKKTGDR